MGNARANYVILRLTIAFVWIYHGVVPKLLGPHADEIAMNTAAGFTVSQAKAVAYVGGAGEVLFGLVILLLWQKRWPLVCSAAAMVLLLLFVVAVQPSLLLGAFNPVTTNLCVFVLSWVALRMHTNIGAAAQ